MAVSASFSFGIAVFDGRHLGLHQGRNDRYGCLKTRPTPFYSWLPQVIDNSHASPAILIVITSSDSTTFYAPTTSDCCIPVVYTFACCPYSTRLSLMNRDVR
jgi:hypothetical protein